MKSLAESESRTAGQGGSRLSTEAELDQLQRLIKGALTVWKVPAEVRAVPHAAPTVAVSDASGVRLFVTRQRTGNLPPCWEVRHVRTPCAAEALDTLLPRRYAAVPGMLRGIRGTLDPEGMAGRLVIGGRPA